MGLLFFPRGGSAQVARYLSAALMRSGWSVDLVAGFEEAYASARDRRARRQGRSGSSEPDVSCP